MFECLFDEGTKHENSPWELQNSYVKSLLSTNVLNFLTSFKIFASYPLGGRRITTYWTPHNLVRDLVKVSWFRIRLLYLASFYLSQKDSKKGHEFVLIWHVKPCVSTKMHDSVLCFYLVMSNLSISKDMFCVKELPNSFDCGRRHLWHRWRFLLTSG